MSYIVGENSYQSSFLLHLLDDLVDGNNQEESLE